MKSYQKGDSVRSNYTTLSARGTHPYPRKLRNQTKTEIIGTVFRTGGIEHRRWTSEPVGLNTCDYRIEGLVCVEANRGRSCERLLPSPPPSNTVSGQVLPEPKKISDFIKSLSVKRYINHNGESVTLVYILNFLRSYRAHPKYHSS